MVAWSEGEGRDGPVRACTAETAAERKSPEARRVGSGVVRGGEGREEKAGGREDGGRGW